MQTGLRYRFLVFWLSLAALLISLPSCAWFGDESKRAKMMSVPEMSQSLAAVS
ncbi:MAG: hypothetical protein PSV18_14705 [Methylobacter sp.]|nr:hypothetical protein [Candidatus Methylobacter titanis]